MTTVTERKFGSICRCERRKPLLGGLAIGFESLSRFKARPFGSPQRLSAGFGIGLAPSQTEQKSHCQSADGARRQFAASPPARKFFTFRSGQLAQDPQEPECRRHHVDPNLDAAFGFGAVELSAGQSEIAFKKSDAVLDAEPLVVNRLGFARRGTSFLRRRRHEDQPQRALVTRLAIGLVFNHPIELKRLWRPLPHPHIVPTTDFNTSAIVKLPFLSGVNRRQPPRVIELDLSPAHRRTPETRIRRRRQEEDAIARHAPQNWDAQALNRLEKGLAGILRINGQRLIQRPAVSFDELLQLRDAVRDWVGFRRDPADLQRERPTSLANALTKQRQTMSAMHPRSAMNVAQLDGFGLGARVIARIHNSHAPFPSRWARRGARLRSQPIQTLLSKLLEPVIIFNRLGQLFARPTDSSVKTTPLVAPQGTQGQLDRRGWARPDCQDINQLDQDPARRPKALRDAVTKIFYTRLRGAVVFHHTSSMPLDARLGGGPSSPFFD